MCVVSKGLLEMKVTELKAELKARGEAITGNKAMLRRELHAALVGAHLAEVQARRALAKRLHAEVLGSDDSELDMWD